MSGILYIIAILLVIGWIFGAFVYSVGGLIHVLLVIAIIAIVYNLVTNRRL